MNKLSAKRTVLSPLIAVCALMGAAVCAQAADVTPPKRPPGSARVKIESGEAREEIKRMQRAHKHHHRFHNRKDIARDDSSDDDRYNGAGERAGDKAGERAGDKAGERDGDKAGTTAGTRAALANILSEILSNARKAIETAKERQAGGTASSTESVQAEMSVAPAAATTAPAAAAAAPAPALKALVLYDAPPGTEFEKLGYGYAIMLKNLLSHYDRTVDLVPVHQYAAGKMAGYDATFYLGAYYDNPVPPALLADITASTKTVVWFKYNIWQYAWNAQYNFAAKFGFSYTSLRGLNADPTPSNPTPGFFDTVTYKGKPFVKYYAYDAATDGVNSDPDIGQVTISDPLKATATVTISNPKTGETAPYMVRSGNFWYVADLPFSYIGPRDRYLVLADTLHDILKFTPKEPQQRAMVRLEDVSALVSVQAMKSLTDYLYSKKIPFSIAVIPKYVDAFGIYNGGVPQTVPLSQATNLKTSLNYAKTRGGEIVMHGYTHQYGNIKNKNTGVSGDDYEFWNMATNTPVAEDSTQWALGRYNAGLTDLKNAGYTPVAWETPHYQGSALSSKASTQVFKTTYQRVVYYTADKPNFNAAVSKDFSLGQVYPFVIPKDHYGQRVLPENLGNIEYDISDIDPTSNFNYTAQDLCTNAEYAKTVRGGFASFFFHPFWLEPEINKPGLQDFKTVIDCITNLGFKWVAPSKVVN